MSPSDPESLTGNLMGDFRKYLDGRPLPEKVVLGMENHVRVDSFTDSHPVVREMKGLFSVRRRRFAGIIIDVVFDHFLVQYWKDYNQAEFDVFIDDVYPALQSQYHLMPGAMQRVVLWMLENDWLRSYAELEYVGRVLDRISARIRFANTMEGAIEEIHAHHAELESGFLAFYPQLVRHVEAYASKPVCSIMPA